MADIGDKEVSKEILKEVYVKRINEQRGKMTKRERVGEKS